MGYVSGTAHIRPIRVGFLASEASPTNMREAVDLASRVWGGVYFPLLRSRDPDLRYLSESLAVDVWHPLDEGARETAADMTNWGYRWRGRTPFPEPDTGPPESYVDGLLPVARIAPQVASHWNVAWSEDSPQAARYEVWLGPVRRRPTSKTVDPFHFDGGEFRGDPFPGSPLARTGKHITYRGMPIGRVVAIVGDDPSDLVRLWNIRAMGGEVQPWFVDRPGDSAEALARWLKAPTVSANARTWVRGDGSVHEPIATIDPGNYFDLVDSVGDAIREAGFGVHVSSGHSPAGWYGHHPLQTTWERSFSVQVNRDDWTVDVPLPAVPLEREWSRFPGMVMADLVVHREARLPVGRTMSIPAIRDLSTVIRDVSRELDPIDRPTGEGRAVGVQAAAESVAVWLIPTLALFDRLVGDEIAVSQSAEGRFATHFVERLGGPKSAAASQPAVRAVLHDVSNTDVPRPLARLIESASKHRGHWPPSLSRQDPKTYAKAVVYRLTAARVLLPTLCVTCPTCANEADYRPDDISTSMRCDMCDSDLNLGLALALRGPGNTWRYRLAGNLSSQRVRSALAVMAAQTLLEMAHRAGSSPNMPTVLGLEAKGNGWACEIDVAALVVDGPGTTAVLGEAKGGNDPFTSKDVDGLVRVQQLLRETAHLDTILMFATTKPNLTTDEIYLLRTLCEASQVRLTGRSRPQTLALPIVLTGGDLSWSDLSEEHPWRWRGEGSAPLAALAEESCRRNLGLKHAAPDIAWSPVVPTDRSQE